MSDQAEMLYVAAGMGTNTVAMLVGMAERGIRPDAIAFADTGGEKPHTYQYISVLNNWLFEQGFPAIQVLSQPKESLEENCLRRKALPSVAYGFKTCSQRFKLDPQKKFLNNNEQARAVWKQGGKVTQAIGFDAGEPQRAKPFEDEKTVNWYPLVEWGWARQECREAIARAGLPQPGKSSCFFCPNSGQAEVRELASRYPDLAERAMKMEQNAELTQVQGLGRMWSWTSLLKNGELFDFPDMSPEMPCGCYDGD